MSGAAMNRRLVLEEASRVADGAGGFTEAWTPIGVVWAALKRWPITTRTAPI